MSDPEIITDSLKQKKCKQITLADHIERFDKLLATIDEGIAQSKKDRTSTKYLRCAKKEILILKKDSPKLYNKKRTYTINKDRVSGFDMPCQITKELTEFMEIPEDYSPTRNEIICAIYTYIHLKNAEDRPNVLKWAHLNNGRNLQDPTNKMYIIPDKKLSKLLDYTQYQKDVKEGIITQKYNNKNLDIKTTVIVTDDRLKYCTIQKLIQKQIIKTGN